MLEFKVLNDFESVGNFPYKLRQPIDVSIFFNGDDYISSFKEANISASGDTAEQSIYNLCDILTLKYSAFIDWEISGKKIGQSLKDQWKILQEYMGE